MISARNVLDGRVISVEKGDILAKVRVKVEEPITVTVVIAREAARELGVKPGLRADIVIKATEVIISK
ncbi:MAG: TOBE domain-containing protein [Candidatus Geothermarchaeales archaeon]